MTVARFALTEPNFFNRLTLTVTFKLAAYRDAV